MRADEELFACAKRLVEAGEMGASASVAEPLEAWDNATMQMKRCFSGSWLGYHSRVYFENFAPPPPGEHFSQEWGLQGDSWSDLNSEGEWREYDVTEVIRHLNDLAKDADLSVAEVAAEKAIEIFADQKSEILSILETELLDRPDAFLSKLKADLEGLQPRSSDEIASQWAPQGQVMTRDMIALGQGTSIPAHIAFSAEVASIRQTFSVCKSAAQISTKAASHLDRRSKRRRAAERVGTNVFIGHGRSPIWRELKDFVQDRLSLPWDEFNRVPVAGVTNIARLSEMLDAAAIAFLVMTAEDEMARCKLG